MVTQARQGGGPDPSAGLIHLARPLTLSGVGGIDALGQESRRRFRWVRDPGLRRAKTPARRRGPAPCLVCVSDLTSEPEGVKQNVRRLDVTDPEARLKETGLLYESIAVEGVKSLVRLQ